MQERIGRGMGCAVLIAAAAWTVAASAAPITIDNFSSAQATWPKDQSEIGNPTIETFLGPGTGVLGNVRKTYINNYLPGGGLSNVQVGVFPNPAPGFFEFAASVTAQATPVLQYDADDTQAGSNPALNLDMTLNDTIEVVFSYFDYANAAPLNVTVTVSDGSGQTSDTQALNQVVTFPTTQTLSFTFAGLGVDFSDIDRVSVAFDSDYAADFRVQEIVATPEPAVAALLAAGALMMVRRRR